jgi:hypothetical protein
LCNRCLETEVKLDRVINTKCCKLFGDWSQLREYEIRYRNNSMPPGANPAITAFTTRYNTRIAVKANAKGIFDAGFKVASHICNKNGPKCYQILFCKY